MMKKYICDKFLKTYLNVNRKISSNLTPHTLSHKPYISTQPVECLFLYCYKLNPAPISYLLKSFQYTDYVLKYTQLI